jgi:hypothetical protein
LTLTATTPETDQIFPFVKRFVEQFIGDLTVTPFIDLGL